MAGSPQILYYVLYIYTSIYICYVFLRSVLGKQTPGLINPGLRNDYGGHVYVLTDEKGCQIHAVYW